MEHQIEMKSTKKRVRSSNWDEEEKRLLRQLIMDKIDIVEKKDCTTNTHAQKKAAWQEILSSFNSLNTRQRDMTQIVTQWRNTKGQVKSRESEYRRARLMTGGGPPPPSPSPEDVELMQTLPNEFVVDSNCFDSDSLFLKTMTKLCIVLNSSQLDNRGQCIKASCLHTSSGRVLVFPHSTITQKVQSESEVALIPTSVSQIIIDSEKSVQLTNPPADVKGIELESTPLASTSGTLNKNKNVKRKLYKPLKKLNKMIADDYEYQLFLLTKKSKENKEQREDELHQKRMKILDLEQQYWEKKLKKL